MSHTPGPWKVVDDGHYVVARPSSRHYIAADIWERPITAERQEERASNMRLIAAAPDLLVALKHVAAWFNRLKDDHDSKLGHGLSEAVENWPTISQEPLDLRPVFDAISKAEGK